MGLNNITIIFHIGLIINISVKPVLIKIPPKGRQNMVSSDKWSLNRGLFKLCWTKGNENVVSL